jgi:hypothetical protein
MRSKLCESHVQLHSQNTIISHLQNDHKNTSMNKVLDFILRPTGRDEPHIPRTHDYDSWRFAASRNYWPNCFRVLSAFAPKPDPRLSPVCALSSGRVDPVCFECFIVLGTIYMLLNFPRCFQCVFFLSFFLFLFSFVGILHPAMNGDGSRTDLKYYFRDFTILFCYYSLTY